MFEKCNCSDNNTFLIFSDNFPTCVFIEKDNLRMAKTVSASEYLDMPLRNLFFGNSELE